MILRARIVLPVAGGPIENGAVAVREGRIQSVGPSDNGSHSGDEVVDLGETILLPGFVNAHCHLDYTKMAGMLPPPKSFPDWIKGILAVKAHWSYTEFAQSWMAGAEMLVRTGTTTVADIEAVPELLPEVWTGTPLRVLSLFEMTGVRSQRTPRSILSGTLGKIDSLPAGRNAAGLSPHAPYSTSPELLRLAAEAARERGMIAAVHVAESDAEFAMFTQSAGPLYEWLKNQRDLSDCGWRSPVQHLEFCGLTGPNILAIHANCLGPQDVRVLASTGTHVAHCPRSHKYFQHPAFRFEELSDAGVNVCLGTDSLASVRMHPKDAENLSMFSEMRAFRAAHPTVSPQTVVRMATTQGAKALGRAKDMGELRPGACADMIAIPYAGSLDNAWEAVTMHEGGVSASMIGGGWAVPPGQPSETL